MSKIMMIPVVRPDLQNSHTCVSIIASVAKARVNKKGTEKVVARKRARETIATTIETPMATNEQAGKILNDIFFTNYNCK